MTTISLRDGGVVASHDAAVTLAALGAAPLGLSSTGNAIINVPASLLGTPALALPLLLWLAERPGYRRLHGRRWISAAIAAAGLGWFVARVLGE